MPRPFGPRVRRRRHGRLEDAAVGGRPLDLPGLLQAVVQAGFGVDVVVLQIQRVQDVVAPLHRAVLGLHEVFHHLALGDPVQLVGQQVRVLLQSVQALLPLAQDIIGLLVAARVALLRGFEVQPLQVHGLDACRRLCA